MAGRLDLKRLFSKGLSGLEAGRLVVQSLYEMDQGREPVLSDREVQRLKAGLSTQADSQAYNSMVDLYKAVYMTMQEARIISLQVDKMLYGVASNLQLYLISSGVRFVYRRLPIIVTEKEYRSRKLRQKKRLKARLYCLGQVREWRTEELLGGEDKAEEATDEAWRKAEEQAELEVQKLIDAGKLKPVRLGHKASLFTLAEAEQLKERETDLDGLYLPEDRDAVVDTREDFIRRIEESLAQGDHSEGHEVEYWPDRGVEPENEERLLHHYVSGEQLYKARLPEWRRWIDEYKCYEEEDGQDGGVAVLRELDIFSLDKRGHYDRSWLDRLKDYAKVQTFEKEYETGHSETLEENLRERVREASAGARVLLAFTQVLKEASKVAHLPLNPEEDIYLQGVRSAVTVYNEMARPLSHLRVEGLPAPRLTALDLDKLKPDKTTVRILRERIARGVYGEGLGPEWWLEVSEEEEDTDGQA